MHVALNITAFAASLICTLAAAQTQEALTVTSTVRFNQAEALGVPATLHLPVGLERVPLVVIANSSAGAQDVFLSVLIQPLLDAGFAVLPLDSYTPRQVASTVRNQLQVSTLDMQKDAVRALVALATHPRVDITRSAIVGHSKGGGTAVNLSVEGAYTLSGAKDGPKFRVAAGLSSGCDIRFKDNRVAVQRVRLFHAEGDDYTPIGPCRTLVADWARNGADATLIVYPGGNHSWSRGGGSYDPSIWTFKGCDGKTLAWSDDASAIEVDGRAMPRTDALKMCWAGRGATVGGDRALRPKVVDDLVAFLRESLSAK